MREQRFTKQDWALFRSEIGSWQEAYMGRLCDEYIELLSGRTGTARMKIDIRQVTYKPAEQGTAGQSNSSPPKSFLKPVCGISVVKRKITPVFTEVIFLLVDLKGIEPSNLTDANRALSQLSYRPKSALFMRKKLRNLDF